jgi:hypothetical protein
MAQQVEARTTGRTLEHWRSQDLLPKLVRGEQQGLRPTWTYPDIAGAQLKALMTLRQRTRNPNVLRCALWFTGYFVPTARVRKSATEFLSNLLGEFNAAVAARMDHAVTPDDARWDVVDTVARTIAGKRNREVPRQGRQKLADRHSGMALAIGLVLGVEGAAERIPLDALHAERMMGLDRARRFKPDGVEPWLSGPAGEGLATFARTANLNQMIELLTSSSDDEFEEARSAGRAMVESIAAFSKLADALAGRPNVSGMAGVATLLDDPFLGIMMPPFVLSIRTVPEDGRLLDRTLEAISGAVAPIQTAVSEFDALPTEVREERMRNIRLMPFAQSLQARRILEEFSQLAPLGRMSTDGSMDEAITERVRS